jgi:3-oxoadipate enol-lactonase
VSIVINNRQGSALSVATKGQPSQPAIVFSNALGTDKNMWSAVIEDLSADYFCISYDTRGHAASAVNPDTTLANLAEDVLDILDALGIAKAHFCGISMGGLTAQYLALHAPERLLSISIANSAARIGSQEGWHSRALSVRAQGLSELADSTHNRWFSSDFAYQHDALSLETIARLRQSSAEGYAIACGALAEADLRQQIDQIHLPTLIIAGSADPITTLADAEFMQQHITGSQLQTIAASHLSAVEQPQAFAQILKGFITALAKR